MKRVLLFVSYDGTAYSGWQVQPNGDTIEGQLNKCLTNLFGEEISVVGASRTDAGVHALCNMAAFDTNARMPAERISYAMNQRLPMDIRIIKSMEVAPDFHPRKIETQKTYVYRIYNAEFPNPVKRLYSYFTYVPLDVEKMREAAAYLLGEHDFFSLSTYKPEAESTVRTIYRIDVMVEKESQTDVDTMQDKLSYEVHAEQAKNVGQIDSKKNNMPQSISIRVTGNGFLYHMVRIIAGTLMEVGRGRMQPEDIPKILATKDRGKAGPTAPACGLTLERYDILEDISYLPE